MYSFSEVGQELSRSHFQHSLIVLEHSSWMLHHKMNMLSLLSVQQQTMLGAMKENMVLTRFKGKAGGLFHHKHP